MCITDDSLFIVQCVTDAVCFAEASTVNVKIRGIQQRVGLGFGEYKYFEMTSLCFSRY